jgi:hypothetical protein
MKKTNKYHSETVLISNSAETVLISNSAETISNRKIVKRDNIDTTQLDIRTVSEWYLFVFFILLHLLGTLNSSCKDNQVSQVDQELPSLSEDMSSSQS